MNENRARVSDLRDTLERLRGEVDAAPNDPRLRFQLGMRALELCDWDLAIEAFRHVVQLLPNVEPAHFNLGNAFFEAGRYREAVEAYRAAFALSPECGTLNNLGNSLASEGAFSDAINAYRQAIAFPGAPSNSLSSSHRNLGMAFHCLGRWSEAKEHFVRSVELDRSNSFAFISLCEQLVSEGNWDEARAQFELLKRETPRTTPLAVLESRILLGLKQDRKALECLIENTLEPTDGTLLFQEIAQLHARVGKISEALGCVRSALDNQSQTSTLLCQWIQLLGYGSQVKPQQIRNAAREWSDSLSGLRSYFASLDQAQQRNIQNESPQSGRDSMQPSSRKRVMLLGNASVEDSIRLQVIPWLRGRDRSLLDVHMLWDEATESRLAIELQALVDSWTWIPRWSDVSVANRILSGRYDLLVDLVGHGAKTRLQLAVGRFARTQLVWNYFVQTSGLPEIDFLIQEDSKKELLRDFASEQLVAPDVPTICFVTQSELTRRRDETTTFQAPVRFGYVGPCRFITPESLDLWAELLLEIPEGTLQIATPEFRCNSICQEVLEAFERRKVDSSRVRLSAIDQETMYASLQFDFDVYVDTLPANNGLGVTNALASGAFVLSRCGVRPPERISEIIQSGMKSGIKCFANSDDLVQYAKEMSLNVETLRKEREKRVSTFLASQLCNSDAYAKAMDRLLESLSSRAQETI